MTDWLDAIATSAHVGRDVVQRVHAKYSIVASPALPTPTSMWIDHVTFGGVKQLGGVQTPFTFDWGLEPGVWGVTTNDANLRGKSTVIEVIRWSLRGRSALQPDVRSWLRTVDVGLNVAGTRYQIHVDTDGSDVSGRITPDGGASLATFASDDEFEAAVEDFMLSRLGLQRLAFFQRAPGAETGSRRIEGWPALSEALYIHSTDVLLGDTVMGGLAGRLLQVYLGIPWASTLAASKAAKSELEAAERPVLPRAGRDPEASRHVIEAQVGELRAQLGRTPDASQQLARRALTMNALSVADQSWLALKDQLSAAVADVDALREAELEDERRLLDATETGELKRFFNGLDPKICPRCDLSVGRTRKDREAKEGTCALCGEGSSYHEDAVQAGELSRSLERIKAARQESEIRLNEIRAAFDQATSDRENAREAARSAADSVDDAERRTLELEIARLTGRLEAHAEAELAEAPPVEHGDLEVVRATVRELERRIGEGQQDLFTALNREVVDLGRRFGIANLEAAALDRAGRLSLTKGGVRTWFNALTGGEQLRMKVAVVMALMRIGYEQHIGRHPGLLMIDAPGGHETSDADVRAILEGLRSLAEEIPGVQVFVATARGQIASQILPADRLRQPDATGYLW